ncbi:MAG: hypothetical protein JXR37_03695 [Kiritimatiellae bacterium]|nr:hypothetical protein [Kiritimatiellia bacterium]
MQTITEIALLKAKRGIFTRREAACWVDSDGARLDALLKRAVAHDEIRRICRGLYCLADRYMRSRIHPFPLAQRIHGPSYVSLESALSYHGWIPEAVHAITSASLGRARTFTTPLGLFRFARVPQTLFFGGVDRVSMEDGESFFLATPLKALGDYVCVHRLDWRSAKPVEESLRVDRDVLAGLAGQAFDQLVPLYKSLRVRRFLSELRKDLGL